MNIGITAQIGQAFVLKTDSFKKNDDSKLFGGLTDVISSDKKDILGKAFENINSQLSGLASETLGLEQSEKLQEKKTNQLIYAKKSTPLNEEKTTKTNKSTKGFNLEKKIDLYEHDGSINQNLLEDAIDKYTPTMLDDIKSTIESKASQIKSKDGFLSTFVDAVSKLEDAIKYQVAVENGISLTELPDWDSNEYSWVLQDYAEKQANKFSQKLDIESNFNDEAEDKKIDDKLTSQIFDDETINDLELADMFAKVSEMNIDDITSLDLNSLTA